MGIRSVEMSALLSMLILFSGCGGRESATHEDTDTAHSEANANVEIVAPQELETRIESTTHPISLVHVWATWCLPCVEEFPELVELHESGGITNVAVILLSADKTGDRDSVEGFLRDNHSPWGSLIAESIGEGLINRLSPDWQGGIPASFFFDSEGNLLEWWSGTKTKAEYEQTIKSLLAEVNKNKNREE